MNVVVLLFYYTIISILYFLGVGLNIYLSINPTNNFLDINWFNLAVNESVNYILLITNSTQNNEDVPNNSTDMDMTKFPQDGSVIYELSLNSSEGTHHTDLKFDYSFFRRIEYNVGCYGFWYHLMMNNRIEYSSCVSTKANWMYDMKSLIGNKKCQLVNLLI